MLFLLDNIEISFTITRNRIQQQYDFPFSFSELVPYMKKALKRKRMGTEKDP